MSQPATPANIPQFVPPPEAFAAQANVSGLDAYKDLYNRAAANPEEFWGRLAESELDWFTRFDKVLEWDAPFAKWFRGGRINVSYNCLDRHTQTHRKNKAAIIFEGEPGDQRILTYQELHRLVCRFASSLLHLDLKTGDRAIIYMPMIPEAAIAMLACARLGIPHSVVFGGFSAEALKARIQDLEARVVITADGGWRRGKEVRLKDAVDDALKFCPSVEHCVVYQRTGSEVQMEAGRDHWWHVLDETAREDVEAVPLDSEHPLYVLYTSGTTGKPKGILHTTAGYILQATTSMKHLLVHRRRRLGHRPLLRRLRPPFRRRHNPYV
jgi:acetyl-CoA synthetase